METVGTLASGLAHDFNNVLGGITGSLSILRVKMKKKEISPNTIEKYLNTIDESSKRATNMVKQLLSLSRKQDILLADIDLNASIKHIMEICKNSFDKSIELYPTYYDEPVIIKSDPGQLEQVLLNLCVNASHSMTVMRAKNEKWGGKLSISLFLDENIYKTHGFDGIKKSYWAISIKDEGIGMTDDVIRNIFDPFFTTKKVGTGTGLGLAMVYNIVKQLKGIVKVSSKPNIGSVFTIYLPATDSFSKIEENQKSEFSFKRGEGTVLIIDDEQIMRFTAEEILTECGYDVMVAENGQEGIDIYKQKYQSIKLVLLDMNMPELSGEDTYISLKEINPNVKTILTSGFKQDERVSKVMALGVDKFLEKPYTFESLIKVTNYLLD